MSKRSAKRFKAKRVCFPVEGPLHVIIDQTAGTLVIESPVLGDAREGSDSFILSLRFSALATDGFLRALREMESEIGLSSATPVMSMPAH